MSNTNSLANLTFRVVLDLPSKDMYRVLIGEVIPINFVSDFCDDVEFFLGENVSVVYDNSFVKVKRLGRDLDNHWTLIVDYKGEEIALSQTRKIVVFIDVPKGRLKINE